jgi:hemerythrin-like domain-containing protein
MKRSPELAPLSRDHHVALEAALRLRRADARTVQDAAAHFGDFFEAHGRRHFELEETVLASEMPPDQLQRMLAEHVELRRRADELARAAEVAGANELGELLAAHVRFEEREVFPLLEERLSPARLAELGQALER